MRPEVIGVTVHYKTRTIRRADRTLRLGPAAFRLVAALLAAPEGIAQKQLVDTLWMDDPEGGPYKPANVLQVQWTKLWKPLSHLGLTFVRGKYTSPWQIVDAWNVLQLRTQLQAAEARAHEKAAELELERRRFARMIAEQQTQVAA